MIHTTIDQILPGRDLDVEIERQEASHDHWASVKRRETTKLSQLYPEVLHNYMRRLGIEPRTY